MPEVFIVYDESSILSVQTQRWALQVYWAFLCGFSRYTNTQKRYSHNTLEGIWSHKQTIQVIQFLGREASSYYNWVFFKTNKWM